VLKTQEINDKLIKKKNKGQFAKSCPCQKAKNKTTENVQL